MIHSVRFIQQYSGIVVDTYGRRYVARAYGARRPDDLWDGWFVFFPLDAGRPLATDRETTQSSLAAVSYWASGITTIYLNGALDRARALLPEARLARRQAQAEREEAMARAEAEAYEEAAAAARIQVLEADLRRRETEEQLLAEREASAAAAARLHERAAASARYDASEARRRRQEFRRQRAGAAAQSPPAQAADSGPVPRRRKRKA
jgi:hypothetical protein